MNHVYAVIAFALIATACSPAGATPPGPSSTCSAQYCGRVTLAGLQFDAGIPAGVGFRYNGYADLRFGSEPPANMLIQVNLDLFSISGRKNYDGTNPFRVPMTGTTIQCPYRNPAALIIYDGANREVTRISFNWEREGCSQ